jgi:hypothetical protein
MCRIVCRGDVAWVMGLVDGVIMGYFMGDGSTPSCVGRETAMWMGAPCKN